MKKLVISVLAVMFCLSLSAATSVQVKLVGSNPTYSVSQLTLLEDGTNPAITSGVDAFDASCMMSQSNENSTLIYGMLGGDEYSTVASPDLTGLKIGFKTNEIDTHYTLKFEGFTGTEFTIYDLVAKKSITVNGSTPVEGYGFDVDPSLIPQVAINDRFVINYVPADPSALEACFINNHLTISSNPWSAGKIAVYDGETKKVEKDGTETDIDLTGLTAGKHYTVKFFPTTDITGEPSRTLIIVPVSLP